MHRFTSLRRSRRFAVAVAVAVLVGATAVAAVAALQPADLGFTPKSESQFTNVDLARTYAKNYYGAPNAVAGTNVTPPAPIATWNAPLNQDSSYADEVGSVVKDAGNWLNAKAPKNPSEKKAIVLDVDDTTLTTWNYELFSNWDFNACTNANFVGLTGPNPCPATQTTFSGNLFPATPGMVDLVTNASKMGYAIFWITGRGDSQHKVTIANLVSDTAAGFTDKTSVDYAGKTNVPEIDAGYPMPTPADIGHGIGGNFTDGLFTKPPVGSYPSYLDTPEFCGPFIHASPAASCPTIQYKSGTRAYIQDTLGYDIVADFGDQFSDLLGGYADRTFKMPNPNYYLP